MREELTTRWILVDTDARVEAVRTYKSLTAAQSAVRGIWLPPYEGGNTFHPQIFRLDWTGEEWTATAEPLQPEPVYWVRYKGSGGMYLLDALPSHPEECSFFIENNKGGLDLLDDEACTKVIAKIKAKQS